MKGSKGEIALRLGESSPFEIINVGDASTLCKVCSKYSELVTVEKAFSISLFNIINNSNSSINILIGAKKLQNDGIVGV